MDTVDDFEMNQPETPPPPIKFKCPHCAQDIEVRNLGRKTYHISQCPNRIIVFDGKHIRIPRSKDGDFLCRCSYAKCKKGYATWGTLQNHAAKGFKWLNPSDEIVPDSNPPTQMPISNRGDEGKNRDMPEGSNEKPANGTTYIDFDKWSREQAQGSLSMSGKASTTSAPAPPKHPNDENSETTIEKEQVANQESIDKETENVKFKGVEAVKGLKLCPKNHKSPNKVYIGPDLAVETQVQPFCLYLQRMLRLLVCPICWVVLTSASGLDHVKAQHKEAGLWGANKLFEDVCKELEVCNVLPDPKGLEGMPALGGLILYESALLCNFEGCKAIYSTAKTMDAHHREAHSTADVPTQWYMVHAQKLDRSLHRTLFRVQPPPKLAPPSEDLPEEWMENIISNIQEIVNPVKLNHFDPRNVNAWLRVTEWPDHVGEHEPAFLQSLVVGLKKNEYPRLKEAIEYIVEGSLTLLKKTPKIILRKLNTNDSTFGVNHMPFHRLQNKSSLKNYTLDLIRFVAFLLRDKGDYHLPLPSAVKERIQHLGKLNPKYEMESLSPSSDFDDYVERIVDLLMAIWTQTWNPSFKNDIGDPTLCFVALSSICDDLSWGQPKHVTPTIAGLVYCMHCIFLYRLHHPLRSQKDADIRARFCQLERWKDENKESTWSELYTLQHLASSFVRTTPSFPLYMWMDDNCTKCLWQGHEITLQGLRTMACELLWYAHKLFTEDVMLGLNICLDYTRIKDDLSNTSPHYGFVKDERNSHLYVRNRLLAEIFRNKALHKEFVTAWKSDGTPIMNLARLRQWIASYAEFLLLLMACIEILAGSPSRGMEMTCIQIRNTATRTRGLFAIGKHIAVVCQYTKTRGVTSKDSLIPHSLDPFNSDLAVHAVFILHEMAQFTVSKLWPHRPELVELYHTHLFVNIDRLFDTEDLTTVLKKITLPMLGVEMGDGDDENFVDWTEGPNLGEDDLQELYEAPQNDENGVDGTCDLNLREDNPDGLYEDPKEPSGNVVDLNLITIPGWSNSPKEPEKLEFEYEDSDLEVSEVQAKGICVQRSISATGHQESSHASVERRATKDVRNANSSGGSDLKDYRKAEKAQDESHAKMDPETNGSRNGVNVSGFKDKGTHCDLEQQALQALRKLLKSPPAQWTSNLQRSAVMAALEQETDVIVALPTGSGKTMVPLISALLNPSKVTGIIVPFIALLEDYTQRLMKYGIRHEVFTTRMLSFPEDCPIILSTIDLAVTREYRTCVLRAKARESMNLLLIDEVHEVPTSKNYRPVMDTVNMLSSAGCPIVAMSATIPLPMERLLINDLHLSGHLKIIRASSNHPNLQYKLIPRLTNPENLRTQALSIVNLERSIATSSQDRGLVFVNSVDEGEALSDLLHCEFYHSGVQSWTEKQEMVNRWRGGVNRVMVCTSAFSAGFDYDAVRYVILYGTPYEMIQSVQEMGRAGQDNSPARCYILPLDKVNPASLTTKSLMTNDPHDVVGRRAMYDMLFNSDECLRFKITEFIDGHGISCDSEECEICSRCLTKAMEPIRVEEPRPETMIRRRGELKTSVPVPHPPIGQKKSKKPERPLTEHPIPVPPPPPMRPAAAPARRQLEFFEPKPRPLHSSKAGKVLVPASSPLATSSAPPNPSSNSFSSIDSTGSKRSSPSSIFQKRAAESKRRRVATQMDKNQYASRLKKALTRLDDLCTSCLVKQGDDWKNGHLANDCLLFEKQFKVFCKWRRLIQWYRPTHGKVCMCCYIPQINDDLHPVNEEGVPAPEQCLYPDLVPPLLYLIYMDNNYREAAEKHFGVRWKDEEAFAAWLCGVPIDGHMSNAMALLLWFVEVCWKKSS
ncbi:ATP-dependent DNA helicase tlh2 [Leucoagaricus sp. SymC.cos]|nr:ATP-dependent DNA helicase tlh2 [Leucoagaricus sp. SymC.cos]